MFSNKTIATQLYNAVNNLARGITESNEDQVNLFNGNSVRFAKTGNAECFNLHLFDSFTSEFIKTLPVELDNDFQKTIAMFESMLIEWNK